MPRTRRAGSAPASAVAGVPVLARIVRAAVLAGAAALVVACGSLGLPGGEPVPDTPAAPALPPPAPRAGNAPAAPAPQASVRRGPFANRRIELAGRCNQTDVDGFAENAILDVRGNVVTALNWTIRVGRRGSCSFRGTDFRQVKSSPHIELHSRDGSGCKLMIWQEPRRITLGHSGCERWCSPSDIADEAFPVMFDPRTGGCARIG